jgi:hypothetical protein
MSSLSWQSVLGHNSGGGCHHFAQLIALPPVRYYDICQTSWLPKATLRSSMSKSMAAATMNCLDCRSCQRAHPWGSYSPLPASCLSHHKSAVVASVLSYTCPIPPKSCGYRPNNCGCHPNISCCSCYIASQPTSAAVRYRKSFTMKSPDHGYLQTYFNLCVNNSSFTWALRKSSMQVQTSLGR